MEVSEVVKSYNKSHIAMLTEDECEITAQILTLLCGVKNSRARAVLNTAKEMINSCSTVKFD